jgi:phospholipid/cholesterol/gamma-HCH transport system substrate-binding protein
VRTAIRKHRWDFLALIAIIVVGLGVGGYVLSNQRFYLPKWVPVVGSDLVTVKGEFTTAQSLTPGQGQQVTIAGVPVGEISKVDLVNGRAVVSMKIKHKYAQIYRDATMLLRPKTGLNDMLVELTPGHRSAGRLPAGGTIPLSQTEPNINADEVLAGLDGDTRNYLQLLIGGAGHGLGGQGKRLSADFRRFSPTARETQRITGLLQTRQANIRRTIHNFRQLAQAVGDKDRQLTSLVDASNTVFQAFARQDASLRETLQLLPRTLQATNTNLAKADKLATTLGPSLQALRPGARALGPSLKQTHPFLRDTTPIIQNQLRPFARDALPTVQLLRPAAADLAQVTPNLTDTFKVVNYLLNELAYNPPGKADEGYLFYTAWANHAGASLFSTQDANGPIRRGMILVSCSTLQVLQGLEKSPTVNPVLPVLIGLLDAPSDKVCPSSAQAGTGKIDNGSSPGTTTGPAALSPNLPNVPAVPPPAAKGAGK